MRLGGKHDSAATMPLLRLIGIVDTRLQCPASAFFDRNAGATCRTRGASSRRGGGARLIDRRRAEKRRAATDCAGRADCSRTDRSARTIRSGGRDRNCRRGFPQYHVSPRYGGLSSPRRIPGVLINL
jgi:hypothetical protein